MISSLLHLVGLRPRVYYTLTNFKGGGGGGKAPLAPPQYANAMYIVIVSLSSAGLQNFGYICDDADDDNDDKLFI